MLQSCVLACCSCKKKKHFACFQTQASHADRRAKRGSARFGSLSLKCASLASPVCWKHCHRAGCQIPKSLYHLFFQSSALQCRHMFEGFVCVAGVLLFREKRRREREACLRLPTSPRDPKPNWNEILNDFKVRVLLARNFTGWGHVLKSIPISASETMYLSCLWIIKELLGRESVSFLSWEPLTVNRLEKKKVHDYLCISTWAPTSLLQILKNFDTFIALCSFWLLPLEE